MATKRFEARSVLITGAASGIGSVTARAFAAEGARVLLVDIDGAGVETEAAAIRAMGAEAAAFAADVSDFDQCQAMVAQAVRLFGGLHIAFNNAGIVPAPNAVFEDVPIEEWERIIAVNQTGTFKCMKAEVPALKASGGTVIVNTASGTGVRGIPNMASYVASKHGVVGLTRAAALDLIRYGIRVNGICPGPILTGMTAAARDNPAVRAQLASRTPIGRMGTADEVARAVLFLASEEASYVVGAIFTVDGGSTV